MCVHKHRGTDTLESEQLRAALAHVPRLMRRIERLLMTSRMVGSQTQTERKVHDGNSSVAEWVNFLGRNSQ